MKDLKFAVLGALAIAGSLFLAFMGYLVFQLKNKGEVFTFLGPGSQDFSIPLAGDYSLHRTSAHLASVTPQGYNDGTPIIPTLVVQCATDGRYIMAKRHGLKKRSPGSPDDTFEIEDADVFDYWILDTQKPQVQGPLSETEFTNLRKSLDIADSVHLRDIYELREELIQSLKKHIKKDMPLGDGSHPTQ